MSNAVLFVRVLVSLVVVLGLLGLVARAARRGGLGTTPARRAARIEVLGRQGLGRSSSIVIVRAAERALVLGVTESAISLLAEADVSQFDVEQEPVASGMMRPEGGSGRPSAWKIALEQLRERTVRRS